MEIFEFQRKHLFRALYPFEAHLAHIHGIFFKMSITEKLFNKYFLILFGAYSVSDLPNGDCMWLLLGRQNS